MEKTKDDMAAIKFGEKLKRLRKERNWSQDMLGAKLGVHGRHIGKYETGVVLPSASTLIKFAKLLNVTIDYLLLDEENSNRVSMASEIKDKELLSAVKSVDKMGEEEKKVIKTLIQAFVLKNHLDKVKF